MQSLIARFANKRFPKNIKGGYVLTVNQEEYAYLETLIQAATQPAQGTEVDGLVKALQKIITYKVTTGGGSLVDKAAGYDALQAIAKAELAAHEHRPTRQPQSQADGGNATYETERQLLVKEVGECCEGHSPYCVGGGCLVEKALKKRCVKAATLPAPDVETKNCRNNPERLCERDECWQKEKCSFPQAVPNVEAFHYEELWTRYMQSPCTSLTEFFEQNGLKITKERG